MTRLSTFAESFWIALLVRWTGGLVLFAWAAVTLIAGDR